MAGGERLACIGPAAAIWTAEDGTGKPRREERGGLWSSSEPSREQQINEGKIVL
jgi:hypothetical protein